MKKKIIILSMVVIFLALVIVFYLFLIGPSSMQTSIFTNHVYLINYRDEDNEVRFEKSNIFIDCKEDSDCKLVDFENGCSGYFLSINRNNNATEIENYSSKIKLLGKSDCWGIRSETKDFVPICKNNECSFESQYLHSLKN